MHIHIVLCCFYVFLPIDYIEDSWCCLQYWTDCFFNVIRVNGFSQCPYTGQSYSFGNGMRFAIILPVFLQTMLFAWGKEALLLSHLCRIWCLWMYVLLLGLISVYCVESHFCISSDLLYFFLPFKKK